MLLNYKQGYDASAVGSQFVLALFTQGLGQQFRNTGLYVCLKKLFKGPACIIVKVYWQSLNILYCIIAIKHNLSGFHSLIHTAREGLELEGRV